MAKPRRKIKSPIAKKGNLALSDPPISVKAKARKRSNNPAGVSKQKTAIKGCGASPLQPIR